MFNYCRDLVRRLDYEGYLIASMVCKNAKLDAVMALKAFDAEIATIAHAVKTPEAAAIRYEFWKSGLKRIKSRESVDGHPVLEDLFKANLSASQIYWLESSLKSRSDDSDQRIYTLQDLDDYAHNSLVPILWCVNETISGGTADAGKEHLLDHLGKAQVTLRRLKGLAKALMNGNRLAEQFVPIGLLGKIGLNGPKMIESLQKNNEETSKLTEVVHEMASHAHSHLSMIPSPSKSKLKSISSDSFLKLSKYSCERYLKELERNNFWILNAKVQRIGGQRDGLLPIKLFFNK